jgi:L-asparaginase II
MLALARHRGWETAGYHVAGHPVQNRAKQMLAHYAGLAPSALGEGVDGCGVVAFALPLGNMARAFAAIVADEGEAPRRIVGAMTGHPPLGNMARAFAAIAADEGEAPRRIVGAMTGHPDHVAGHRRLCTEVMQAYPGRVLAKVGAEGVYGAALLDRQLGIAFKVEDGGNAAAMPALVAILQQTAGTRASGRIAAGTLRRTPGPQHPLGAGRGDAGRRGALVRLMERARDCVATSAPARAHWPCGALES